MNNNQFLNFSKPFLSALVETFKLMVQTEVKPHTPKIKKGNDAFGDVTALISMNGVVEVEGDEKKFNGFLALSFPEELYVKMASRMLMEEYTAFCEDISDTGAEIANIIMGNAKAGLYELGYKLEMATPSTIRGSKHELHYPSSSITIAITVSSDLGDFALELCAEEVSG